MKNRLFGMNWGKSEKNWKVSEEIYKENPFVVDAPSPVFREKEAKKEVRKHIYAFIYVACCTLFCTYQIIKFLISLFI